MAKLLICPPSEISFKLLTSDANAKVFFEKEKTKGFFPNRSLAKNNTLFFLSQIEKANIPSSLFKIS